METDDRTYEEKIRHWAETLECVLMTNKYNTQQLAEKLHKAPCLLFSYKQQLRLPREANKAQMMDKLKQIIIQPKIIDIHNHKRIYL